MPGLTHTFKKADATTRIPVVVDGFIGRGEAPGGFTAATATILQSEYDSNPTFYANGVEWIVTNSDDLNKVVWAGTLNDPRVVGETVTLHGDGTAKRADRFFNHWLWQTRDESRWTIGNDKPFDYGVVPQIEAQVNGRNLQFRVRRGEIFRRTNGRARLSEDAAVGDTSINVDYSAGLERGDTVTIGSETKVVSNSFHEDSQFIPLTTALTSAHTDNTLVTWTVPSARPDKWQTSMVFWAPGVALSSISFELVKSRSSANYELHIGRCTGPNGDIAVDRTISMAAGSGTKITQALSGSPDLVMLRLRRTAVAKKARPFRLRIKNIRVNGMASGDDYKTHQVVTDIANKIGGTTTDIQTSTINAMPLDVEDASAGEVLDELSLLDDYYWGLEHNGTTRAWKYGPWSTKTWVLSTPEAPVQLEPVPRYGKVRLPFRHPGGVEQFKTYTATGAPATSDTYQLDLDDPLPPQRIADLFGANIAAYLWEIRYSGQATFLEVEDLAVPGVKVPASRVRMGDRLRLANYGNITLRIQQVEWEDVSSPAGTSILTTVRFPVAHPLVERVTRRRKLLLARGIGQGRATLGGLGIGRPAAVTFPASPVSVRKQDNRRKGFKVVIRFNEVTTDADGDPTSIDYYVGEIQETTSAGTPVGDEIIQARINAPEDEDSTGDSVNRLKMVFRNIDNPETTYYRYRVRAVDWRGRRGPWSSA